MLADEPLPQPAGSLDPPRRHPPTAVATMTPEPPPMPRREARPRRRSRLVEAVRTIAINLLDLADDVARLVTPRH